MTELFKMAASIGALVAMTACTGTGTTDTDAINSLVQKADGNTAIVARSTGFAGSAPRIFVLMDGQQVAALGSNEVGSFQASPGTHTLGLKFEGPNIGLEINELTYVNDPSKPQYFVITLEQKFTSAEMIISEVLPGSFAHFLD